MEDQDEDDDDAKEKERDDEEEDEFPGNFKSVWDGNGQDGD